MFAAYARLQDPFPLEVLAIKGISKRTNIESE